MEQAEFELVLNELCKQLTAFLLSLDYKITPKEFESEVRSTLSIITQHKGFDIDLEPPAQEFPDIIYDKKFGIEVKYTENDTWRSIANSIFEGRRNQEVSKVYLLFGKSGGIPEVKWNRYEDCIMHVRTSHVPRFEVEIDTKKPLFEQLGIGYEHFRLLPQEQKMPYIRDYAKGRLKKGEHLWWIEDDAEDQHTLPLEVKLYTKLGQEEKRRYRAEAVLLCPQVVQGSRSKGKYDDVTMYLLTYHGVLCNNARDLFSAGSVAMRSDQTRGGDYIIRAIIDIQNEILAAAEYLEDGLFIEYWGYNVEKDCRIEHWLGLLDKNSNNPEKPSTILFCNQR